MGLVGRFELKIQTRLHIYRNGLFPKDKRSRVNCDNEGNLFQALSSGVIQRA
jgi:hypothetical protein